MLEHWRSVVERDGLPVIRLLACDDEASDATNLSGCAKSRIPWPDGPWGAVFTFDVDADGLHLVLVALGLRHPPPS